VQKLSTAVIVYTGGSMDFSYRIDKANRIVYLEGPTPDMEGWKQTFLTLFADADYEKGFDFLFDRRSIEVLGSTQFIKATISFFSSHKEQIEGCKWAIVISSTAAFGLGRMAQILSEDILGEMQIFTDIDKARQWLIEGRKPT
jgi:hypothetical protein